MNQWHVKWKKQAVEDLASIWNSTQDKTSVAKAAHHLEDLLKRSPQHHGESRGAMRRIIFEKPISLIYEMILDDRKVLVLLVNRY